MIRFAVFRLLETKLSKTVFLEPKPPCITRHYFFTKPDRATKTAKKDLSLPGVIPPFLRTLGCPRPCASKGHNAAPMPRKKRKVPTLWDTRHSYESRLARMKPAERDHYLAVKARAKAHLDALKAAAKTGPLKCKVCQMQYDLAHPLLKDDW